MINPQQSGSRRNPRIFATPMEVGLRVLFILDALSPEAADLQRLVIYDYLTVHSADAGGADSLHPAVPHRSGELVVKRQLVKDALRLMLSRDLLQVRGTSSGVQYAANDVTSAFISHLDTSYAKEIRERSAWVAERFGSWRDEELAGYIGDHLGRWGGEFSSEAIVREVP
jgi:hypothetical protein